MSEHRVKVDNGKYEFIRREDGAIDVLRHGDPWLRHIMPQNGIDSMMCDLDAARLVVQFARAELKAGLPMSMDLQAAIELHDRLTSDREPPSAWCGVEQHTPAARSPSITFRDAVHSAVAGALCDKEPRWSVERYRALCDEIAGRVMEAIEEVQPSTEVNQ